MAKCPKCESTTFKLEAVGSPTKSAFIICSECEVLISVMEDIDFRKWYDKLISNHGYFENQINILKSEMKTMSEKHEQQNNYIIELLEIINRKL
ncbi:hypothetical protein [Lysinibacillus xylanilyticus]|uniref:hypothetical protein n=1 Tax=Lysinibacillus xylanilyticus TaxID=582475 RepID=UPI0036DF22B7